ncbi:hypothetical protein B0H13DRAFT_2380130 [Mycena leptocephala]|nr:hypothetical protein B0H13DRAFT_2380130 [Mycena leptocephala]
MLAARAHCVEHPLAVEAHSCTSAKEVKEIQTAMLLIIEEERQRKLAEGIKDSQEVLRAVVLRRAYRRSDSDSHVFRSYKYASS